jgi:hypothetical protein
MRYTDNILENTTDIFQIPAIQKEYSKAYSDGDSSILGSNFLTSRNDIVLNERWEKTTLLSARILKITDDVVHCDCILSLENQISQVRSFSRFMFDSIYPLKENTYVKIKISTKSGSMRTDIIDGKGLDIEKDFEIFDLWSGLEDFDNKPAF